MPGQLTVVATPIGNLGDLSGRAAEALGAAEYWLVEDTRVSGKLASHLKIKKPMRIVNDHTNLGQVERLVAELAAGAHAALLTDGGTPVVSDPGAILVDLCHEKNVDVRFVPGPSAPIAALSVSGFFGQRFAFLGFLGRKPKDIRSELAPFADSPLTLILFESPHRIEALFTGAFEALGPRRYAIGRELTKAFEQIYRGRLPDVPSEADVPRKGEFTVVFEGLRRKLAH
jgi:16S rRNA (cytidine1402-2'-O)-methyltransferase